jgi:hypothetical protein
LLFLIEPVPLLLLRFASLVKSVLIKLILCVYLMLSTFIKSDF